MAYYGARFFKADSALPQADFFNAGLEPDNKGIVLLQGLDVFPVFIYSDSQAVQSHIKAHRITSEGLSRRIPIVHLRARISEADHISCPIGGFLYSCPEKSEI